MDSNDPRDRHAYTIGGCYHQLDGKESEDEVQHFTGQMIARALMTRRTVAFVGSGMSVPYGYPSWGALAAAAMDLTEQSGLLSEEERALLGSMRSAIPQRGLMIWTESNRPWHDVLRAHAASDHTGWNQLATSDRTLTAFELCERAWRRNDKSGDSLRKQLAESIRPKPKPDQQDPIQGICQILGIDRFLTTNYDLRIENSLFGWSEDSKCDVDVNGMVRRVEKPTADEGVSISISGRRHPELLVQFALGGPGFKRGVFHLHGIRWDPANMILTESDYAATYMRDDPGSRAYRDALRLTFAANPVLFLGLGMTENDLLGALRRFAADNTGAPRLHPFFAILPRRPKEKENEQEANARRAFRNFVASRFGVYTYFYACNDQPNLPDFVRGLREIDRARSEWWDAITAKPPIRRPEFTRVPEEPRKGQCQKCYRHRIANKDVALAEDLQAVHAMVHKTGMERPRTILVLGRPGAGKGSLGIEIVDRMTGAAPAKAFYASFHFTNDMLSLIDGCADFLLGSERSNALAFEDPIARLRCALTETEGLVVLSGLERLLRPGLPEVPKGEDDAGATEVPRLPGGDDQEHRRYPMTLGHAASHEAGRLLEMIDALTLDEEAPKSQLVLTSALVPAQLRCLESTKGRLAVHRMVGPSLDRFTGGSPAGQGGRRETQRARPAEPASAFRDPRALKALHRVSYAVRRHAYAMSVLLAAMPKQEEPALWLEHVARTLTSSDLGRRPESAIRLVLDRVRVGSGGQLLIEVLKAVAGLTTPVDVEVVAEILPGHDLEQLRAALAELVERRLLLEVKRPEDSEHELVGEAGAAHCRYTAHTVMRKVIATWFGRIAGAVGEAHQFDLTSFSADGGDLTPVQASIYKERVEGVDRLLRKAASLLPDCDPDRPEAVRRVHNHLRAAFGILRFGWNVNSAGSLDSIPREQEIGFPRQHVVRLPPSHLHVYQRRLVEIVDLARRLAAKQDANWSTEHESSHDRAEDRLADWQHITHGLGLLYADELAWLYNEVALAAYAQGSSHDAAALMRLASHANMVAERRNFGHRWCASELNLGLAHMDRGRLQIAERHMRAAFEGSIRNGDDSLTAQVHGYLGLLHHLRGGFEVAMKCYDCAVAGVRATGNRRGESIFLRHQGDLMRVLGQDGAVGKLEASLRAAQACRATDLAWYAHAALANALIAGDAEPPASKLAETRHRLAAGIDYARKIGLPKLEADIRKVQGHMALRDGDTAAAADAAIEVMSIAAMFGMELRVTATLILMGRVAKACGRWEGARSYFTAALQMAEFQRYQLQAEVARNELAAIVVEDSSAGAIASND